MKTFRCFLGTGSLFVGDKKGRFLQGYVVAWLFEVKRE